MAVQGTVRGKALWFDLDSGGIHSIIDSSTANTLHLTSARTLNVRGAGSGQVLATQLAAFDVQLGHARFRPSDPLSLDLSNAGSVIGARGLLGFELFSRYVVEFNYDRHLVVLYEPKDYAYSGNGVRVPIVIRPPRAFVSVLVSAPGVAAERHLLRLDTGSSDSVDDDIILKSSEPKRRITGGVGIGSRFQTYLGQVSMLQIGPFTLHNNLTSVTGGVQLIGTQVWHRFNMVFDFSRSCMYLSPRHTPSTSLGAARLRSRSFDTSR